MSGKNTGVERRNVNAMLPTNIKVNQHWQHRLFPDRPALRILAPHPDGGYLVYDWAAAPNDRVSIINTLRLDDMYVLKHDVCTHKHVTDGYFNDSAVPNYYVCNDCGDKFPNTGDTALWFPKVILEDK